MQVRVEGEFLIPGVQDGHAAHAGAEILGLRADSQQGFTDADEEGVVEEVAISLSQGNEFVGNRENHMEVRTGEEFAQAGVYPPRSSRTLAERTVPVTAGIVVNLAMPTLAG